MNIKQLQNVSLYAFKGEDALLQNDSILLNETNVTFKLPADSNLFLVIDVESIENAYLIGFRKIFIDPVVDPLAILEDEFELFGLKENTLYFLIAITVLTLFFGFIAFKCYRQHQEEKSRKLI